MNFNIKKAYAIASSRNWEKIYWAIDLHGTVLIPTYSHEISTEFYQYAENVLKFLSQQEDVVLIMYTSTSEEHIKKYIEFFEQRGIYFKYVNKNPEVENTEYADFNNKFYFNILLDDKAGFEGDSDWIFVQHELYDLY